MKPRLKINIFGLLMFIMHNTSAEEYDYMRFAVNAKMEEHVQQVHIITNKTKGFTSFEKRLLDGSFHSWTRFYNQVKLK